MILNNYQINFLKATQQNSYIKDHFYLAWGTALAAHYLLHRLSDDLDFFSTDAVDFWTISQRIIEHQDILQIKQWTHRKYHDRNLINIIYLDWFELKCEFTRYMKPIFKTRKADWYYVEHQDDIIIDKVACMIDRNDPKDFVDIYYLFKDQIDVDRSHWLNLYQQKFWNTLSLHTFWYSLLKGTKITLLPHIIDKTLELKTIHEFFLMQAKNCGHKDMFFE